MSFAGFAEAFFAFSVTVGIVFLVIAVAMTVIRIVLGPTLPDRVLGLDMLTSIGMGFIALIGITTGYTLYVDIAIGLGLVGFLATVAFARFILARGKDAGEESLPSKPAQSMRMPKGKI